MIIVAIISLMAAIFACFVYRYYILKQVAQLEQRKSKLESASFSHQLARVKNLTMDGEAEMLFEKWKSNWEAILNESLPVIQEYILDIEDDAKRFRFIAAKRIIAYTQKQLHQCEQNLDQIKKEIDDLVSRAADVDQFYTELTEQCQFIRSQLKKDVSALGVSFPYLKKKFEVVIQRLDFSWQLLEEGNYYEAHTEMEQLAEQIEEMTVEINELPELINEVEVNIPKQLDELETAVQEMKKKQYQLANSGAEEALITYRTKQSELVQLIQNGQLQELKKWKESVAEDIEDKFQRLEEEIEIKSFVFRHVKQIPQIYVEITQRYQRINDQAQRMRQAYSWTEEMISKWNGITDLMNQLENITAAMQTEADELHDAYSQYHEPIKQFNSFVETCSVQLDEIEEYIEFLQVDLKKVWEEAANLQQAHMQLLRRLKRSNLPGLPAHLQRGLEMAESSMNELEEQLDESPLDLHRLQHVLEATRKEVNSVSGIAITIIDQVQQSERLIQYANRYRRSNKKVQTILHEAETAFHNYEFGDSLLHAQQALDIADDNWRVKLGTDVS